MQFKGGGGGVYGREKESLIDHVGYGSLRELSKIAA